MIATRNTTASRSGRAMVAGALVTILVLGLAGCGSDGKQPGTRPTASTSQVGAGGGDSHGTPRVAIVTTERANQLPIALTPQLRTILMRAVEERALISVSTADGTPRTVQTL